MMYFYEPKDKAAKPFIFEHDGNEYVAQNPHMYWKKEVQPYVIERFFNKITGAPEIDTQTGEQKVVMGRKTVWVPDDEKNKELAAGKIQPPFNGLHISKRQWKDIQTSKHKPMLKLLVSQEQKFKEERNELQSIKQEFDTFEKDKKSLEEEREQLKHMREEVRKQRERLDKEMARK